MKSTVPPRDASEEEIRGLRHVVGEIPTTTWIVALTGAASKFAFYGLTVPWRE